VVSFLNEAAYLPRLLCSLAAQTEPADQLLLVDDGSTDDSLRLSRDFAEQHPYARALSRPRRPADVDRLVSAPELQAFTWGVPQLEPGWDIVAKVDGDLEFRPGTLAAVREEFSQDPRLGITGSYLTIETPDGRREREWNPPEHVRGPNKFYRRECYEQITPLPAYLGWDTIDDLRARRLGWATRSFSAPDGDTLHLRPTGVHDGRLRAYRRWGRCAWGYGAHPAWVALGAVRRAAERPYLIAGASYWAGWANAAVRRYPRAEPELRAFAHGEQLAAIRNARQLVRRARA
jgi:hypothetical protein